MSEHSDAEHLRGMILDAEEKVLDPEDLADLTNRLRGMSYQQLAANYPEHASE